MLESEPVSSVERIFSPNPAVAQPGQLQKEYFLTNARKAAIRPLLEVYKKDDNDEQRRVAVDRAIVTRRGELSKLPFAPGIDESHVIETVAGWRDELVAMLNDVREALSLTYPDDLPSLAELGMQAIFKVPGEFVGTTGLVFAGFGDHEIFPAMVEYEFLRDDCRKTCLT